MKTEYTITKSKVLGVTSFLLYSPDELIGKFHSQKAAFNFIKKIS